MNWRSLLRHKWKIFVLSWIVKIVFIVGVAVTTGKLPFHHLQRRSVVVEKAAEEVKQTISFDDYFAGKFSYRNFYPQWVSGSTYTYMNDERAIVIRNITSDEERVLLEGSVWDSVYQPYSWSISPDQQYVIITSNYTDGYAHYVRTFAWSIFDTTDGSQLSAPALPSGEIQKFKWSNNGHNLAFVREFDLFISLDFGTPSRLTSDGMEGSIFNGITDWLYVQEITDDDALFWWSPTDEYISFATLRQDGVRQFEFSVYDAQYPTMVKLPYPKPGTPIPQVTMSVVTIADMSIQELNVRTCTSFGDEFYLNTAIWRNSKTFTAVYKNRYENEASTRHYSADDGFTCFYKQALDNVMSETGWLGHYKPHDVIPMNDEEFATVNSHEGFMHLQVVDHADGLEFWRTSGEFEVTDTNSGYHAIFHYDPTHDWIYFTSTEQPDQPGMGLPSIRHLWRVQGHGGNLTRMCVTCELNEMYADRCNWVTPSFSHDGSYLSVNCGGTIKGRPVSVMMTRNEFGDYGEATVTEDNLSLQTNLDAYDVRNVELGSIRLPHDDTEEFYYILFTPPNLDPTKKYPLLVEVYSGPGYQRAYDRFSFGWKDYVASSLDVVVMSFDGRGTGFRGDKIMHEVYKKLGQFEPQDQIEAARQIVEKHDFIDGSRTAIWGWSYGGYTTTRTIESDGDNVFKCGFAVAPVIDWKLYHSIYTERYMLSPDDNEDGYLRSTALQQSTNVARHRYAVLHGTRDENVHFQNSAQLEKYLVEESVDFGAYFFADNDHGMSNTANNYKAVYRTIQREMSSCFGITA